MRFKSVFAASAVFFALTAAPASQAADQTLGMAIMSAHVDYYGILKGGAGAVGASKQTNGQYFVAFNRSVEGCTYIGAVSGPTAANYIGFAIPVGKVGTFNGAAHYGVQVDTSDHNTLITDRPFHLLVFCAQ
jgi:hypothetical protein